MEGSYATGSDSSWWIIGAVVVVIVVIGLIILIVALVRWNKPPNSNGGGTGQAIKPKPSLPAANSNPDANAEEELPNDEEELILGEEDDEEEEEEPVRFDKKPKPVPAQIGGQGRAKIPEPVYESPILDDMAQENITVAPTKSRVVIASKPINRQVYVEPPVSPRAEIVNVQPVIQSVIAMPASPSLVVAPQTVISSPVIAPQTVIASPVIAPQTVIAAPKPVIIAPPLPTIRPPSIRVLPGSIQVLPRPVLPPPGPPLAAKVISPPKIQVVPTQRVEISGESVETSASEGRNPAALTSDFSGITDANFR